jgi:hypothetical protein
LPAAFSNFSRKSLVVRIFSGLRFPSPNVGARFGISSFRPVEDKAYTCTQAY